MQLSYANGSREMMTSDTDLLALSPEASAQAPQASRPDEGDPAKRRQIVEGARTVFLERGFEGASMGEIARCAGVSKGTLYVYYQNKEQLFCAIMEDERRSHLVPLLEIDRSEPVEAALRAFGRRLVSFILSPRKVASMRTAMAIAEQMPEVGRDFYARGPGHAIKVVRSYLDDKVAQGELDIPDTGIAATQLLDLVQSSLIRPALFGIEIEEQDREARIGAVVDSGVRVFLRAYGRMAG
jgi:AcrR family transcriptional regulator